MNTQHIIKRLLVMIVVLAALVALAAGCGKNAPETPDTTVTTTTQSTLPTTTTTMVNGKMDAELNVREGPGSQYAAIGGVLIDESVEIVGREGDWYKIRFADTYGYINAHYVEVEGNLNVSEMQAERPQATTTTAFKKQEGVVKGETAKVYPAPDNESEPMGELKKDKPLTITGKDGDWYEIEYNGGIGYIKAEDFTKVTTTTAPSVAGTGKVTTTTGKNGIPNTNVEDTLD